MEISGQQTMPSKKLLYEMLRIRMVENAIADRYTEQEMRSPMHLCIGQEAIAVGVSSLLNKADVVFSNHRAHGHYLAKGGSLNAMIAELYGRKDGCCGGRGGSMHLIDLNVGFLGSTPIVGGTVPLSVGAAWAKKIKNDKGVVVVYFGDGCFEEGVVHESLNFSALHKLPIIFICENNNFSVYTRLENRQPARPIYKLAMSHGMGAFSGNGNDVIEVRNLFSSALEQVNNGNGPQFLEFRTYRWREHCGPNFDDSLGYRSENEIKEGKASCPIQSFVTSLTAKKLVTQDEIQDIQKSINLEISGAFEFAALSEKPNFLDAKEGIYAR